MPNYKPRAKKRLSAVWLVGVSPVKTIEDFVVPEVTVAVDWQADPRQIERDFGVLITNIRHERRKDLERMRDITVARAANEIRRPHTRRLKALAVRQGVDDPVRVALVSESVSWPGPAKVARHLSPPWLTAERVKRPLRRYRAAYRKAIRDVTRRQSCRRG